MTDPRPATPECSPRLVVLTHAATDILALDRARADLPTGFPACFGHSLVGLTEPAALRRLIGGEVDSGTVVVARLHGPFAGVPGLDALATELRRAGGAFVAISGVAEDADPALANASTVSPTAAAELSAYFMAGGADNIGHALRYLAHTCLGVACSFAPPQAMPAHGLYHPDWLVLTAAEWQTLRPAGRPVVFVVFYRAHALSGNVAFVDALIRPLEARGFAAIGVFTSSLRECDPAGLPLALTIPGVCPDLVVNTVSFPVFVADGNSRDAEADCFARLGAPIIQAIPCGSPRSTWLASARGLGPIETSVAVALPESDGRIVTVPISFKEQHRYVPDEERCARVAAFVARLHTLRTKPNAQKRIAIILTNSGGKAARVGGAVGLDTPASLVRTLEALRAADYGVGDFPADGDALMSHLLSAGSYDEQHPLDVRRVPALTRVDYVAWFQRQPVAFRDHVVERWGAPSAFGPTSAPARWVVPGGPAASLLPGAHEPHSDDVAYFFAAAQFGNVLLAIEPPRGFGLDPAAIYHAPDLPPTHHYAAFHAWLREHWRPDALIHFGKHGTLEWMPGKSVALSAACAPDVLLGDLPLFYPFVMNDPGEGAQAKRRAHAVILDHLVPPLTHAGMHGPLATLARLVEETYRAESLDPAKLPLLHAQIWDLVRSSKLDADLREIGRQRHGEHVHEWDERPGESGAPRSLEKLDGRGMAHLLEDLDAYLCELGRAQIRHGLHVFGQAPADRGLVDLCFAALRCPNGEVPALIPAVVQALGDSSNDSPQARRSHDEIARTLLGELAAQNYSAAAIPSALDTYFPKTAAAQLEPLRAVLAFVCDHLAPNLARTTDELLHLLHALDGRHVPAGPSGAPSRGMAHALPTGRNFFSADPRGLPSPAAWTVGQGLAREALDRYLRETGALPESVALSIWGTATMRTGGDDVAQALALLGIRPVWHAESRRTTGLEPIPLAELGRPRIDVTLRISGFFRDAFPQLVQLLDRAARLAASLDEPGERNFMRKHWLDETARLVAEGTPEAVARRQSSYRVFSSPPGAYGTGMLELIETRAWRGQADLAAAFLVRGGWAYTEETPEGVSAEPEFRRRLSAIELALHNQDNREHDILDSDDYFQFHGGLVATISALAGRKPRAYFGDSSDPAQPEVRTLQAEALRVYRSRVTNPKWIEAMHRHGYKGGLELAATVDYLFGFSATTGIVTEWMFEGIAESYTRGATAEFLQRSNPWALHAIAERLLEAHSRALWAARPETLASLQSTLLASEGQLEAATPSPR